MYFYFSYYIFFSFLALITFLIKNPIKNEFKILNWILIFVITVLIIGLRYRVGGDWSTYLHYYNQVNTIRGLKYDDYFHILNNDPIFYALNKVSFQTGIGFIGLNFVAAFIFLFGLVSFCLKQPFPTLSFAISIPYLIFIVSMGYTRQSIGLGLILFAFSILNKKNFAIICLLTIVAAFTHKTFFLFLPIIFLLYLIYNNNFLTYVKVVFLSLIFLLFIFIVFGDSFFINVYKNFIIGHSYDSSGALIRLIYNLIPISLFLLLRKKIYKYFSYLEYNLYLILSFVIIIMTPFVFEYSTFIDRNLINFSFIQIAIYPRLILIFKRNFDKIIISFLILFFYFAMLFVWMNYSAHRNDWLPYQFYNLNQETKILYNYNGDPLYFSQHSPSLDDRNYEYYKFHDFNPWFNSDKVNLNPGFSSKSLIQSFEKEKNINEDSQ